MKTMKLQKRGQAQRGLFPFSIYKPIIIPAAELDFKFIIQRIMRRLCLFKDAAG
jgi:hypothetical protein